MVSVQSCRELSSSSQCHLLRAWCEQKTHYMAHNRFLLYPWQPHSRTENALAGATSVPMGPHGNQAATAFCTHAQWHRDAMLPTKLFMHAERGQTGHSRTVSIQQVDLSLRKLQKNDASDQARNPRAQQGPSYVIRINTPPLTSNAQAHISAGVCNVGQHERRARRTGQQAAHAGT